MFDIPGVSVAVLQTPLFLSESVIYPYPPNLHDIITPPHYELGLLNLRQCLPHVTYHMSPGTY